jgi:hypothetical protein
MAKFYTNNFMAVGFIAGLGMGEASSLLLCCNQVRSEILVKIIDLLAGLPVVFSRQFDIPKPIFYLVFFSTGG